MVKIITSAKHKFGHKNVIPYLGETLIGTDGVIEVADLELANKVCTAVPDFSIVDESIPDESTLKPKVEENTLGKEAGSKLSSEPGKIEDQLNKDEGKKAEDPMTDAEAEATLNNKTLLQLQEFAKDAGLPAEQWGSLQKPKLKEYLKGVLTGKTAQ